MCLINNSYIRVWRQKGRRQWDESKEKAEQREWRMGADSWCSQRRIWCPVFHLLLLCFFSPISLFLGFQFQVSVHPAAVAEKSRSKAKHGDNRWVFPRRSLSLPLSVWLSAEVKEAGRWAGKEVVFLQYSLFFQFRSRVRITWPALSFTSLFHSLTHTNNYTHSEDYGSRKRWTFVSTRKWIYWFYLL